MIKESRAYKYAKWCADENNHRVGVYVRKQCRTWLDICDGNDNEAYIDEKTYKKICKILRLMVHPDLNIPMYDGLEDRKSVV